VVSGVVEFGGTGPAFLVLHGLMGRATTWWPVARWLTAYGRVVGLDARGHGRSPRPAPATTEDFVADAAALITDLGLGPAVVLGHSMGGLHGLVLAAEHPSLVRGVVVEDIAPDQRGRTSDGWRAELAGWPVAFESIAHVREFFGRYGDYFAECVEERDGGYHLIADPADLFATSEEWGRRSYWPYVDRIRCPVLAIEAEHSFMPPGQMLELARRVPGGRYLRIPGTGHVVHADAPDAYRHAVEAFLADLQR
jgi:pimeloyl-ACP methyl ester carboxylesterase